MGKIELDDFVKQYEAIEEIISFEDKISEITSDTRKNVYENYSLDLKNYLLTIENLVKEHKENIRNIIVSEYENLHNNT